MGEIVITPRQRGGGAELLDDGDVIEALTSRQIQAEHVSNISHPRRAPFSPRGLREFDGLSWRVLERVCEGYLVRVSAGEAMKVYRDGRQELVSNRPNAFGHSMDVAEFFRRRLAASSPLVFEDAQGRAVWFIQETHDFTDLALSEAWDRIEASSPLVRSAFAHKNRSPHELRRLLMLPVDNLPDHVAAVLSAAEVEYLPDENDARAVRADVVRRRKFSIDWRGLPGMTPRLEADVLDQGKITDLRGAHIRLTRGNQANRKPRRRGKTPHEFEWNDSLGYTETADIDVAV